MSADLFDVLRRLAEWEPADLFVWHGSNWPVVPSRFGKTEENCVEELTRRSRKDEQR